MSRRFIGMEMSTIVEHIGNVIKFFISTVDNISKVEYIYIHWR